MSTCDSSLSSPLQPVFFQREGFTESNTTQTIIDSLTLQKHPEGGYFVETDRDSRHVPNPFTSLDTNEASEACDTRSASTTIYYMITPGSPLGGFHRNKGRTVHTLHKGRGRYVIIHADEVRGKGQKARIETFVVGHDIAAGEKLQWIVEGGKFKASFLMSDLGNDVDKSDGLLISETVVPGFEFEDHDFMTPETLKDLVTTEENDELAWLLRDVSPA